MPRRQDHKETGLVKMLAYVLGVAPHEFGLVPDAEGWITLKELTKALHEEDGWRGVRESMITDAVNRLAPDQLELDEKLIRSRERKSPRPRPGVEPPPHIFIGLRRRAWPALKDRGLEARDDIPLVLAKSEEFALRLGRRRDAEPVLVTVQAQQAMDLGVIFSGLGEELFLADWIPADCLMGPPVPEKMPPRKSSKSKAAKPKPDMPSGPVMPSPESMPGSFIVQQNDVDKPYKRKGIEKRVKWKDERRKGTRRKGKD
jgi:putative RNA 2'-phosphotransferase